MTSIAGLEPLIFELEKAITKFDQEAPEDLVPKDSEVKSALRKAEGILSGKVPAKQPKGKREQWVADLSGRLVEVGRNPPEGMMVSPQLWPIAMRRVVESLDVRKGLYGSTRSYLDFVKGFLRDAEKKLGDD